MPLDRPRLLAAAHDFLKRWNCAPDGEILFTSSGLLWPVAVAGEKLILKIADPDDDEAQAAEMLRFYDGHGAARLVESLANAQLIERISGKVSQPTLEQLVLAGQDDAATEIICRVVAELHQVARTKNPPANLIPFRKRSDEMRKHLDDGRVKVNDRRIFAIACDLCDELIAETLESQMPLHGDIHHFNILRSDDRGWLAIDPKGICGPRIYEYANTLCNPWPHTEVVANPRRMARQAAIIAEQARLEKTLLIRFTFLHAVQAAAWSFDQPDQEYWLACARTAARLAEINLK